MEPLPPAAMAAARLTDLAFERGLIIYWRRTRGGASGDHVMVCPPLIVTREQVDTIIERLADALQALTTELEMHSQ